MPGQVGEARRPTTAEGVSASKISAGCVFVAVATGSVGFAVIDLVATLVGSHVGSDVEVSVAELVLSPFTALLSFFICLPLVALANRFWFSGRDRNGRRINRHTLCFALACYIIVVCACAFIGVPPGDSIFWGNPLSADLMAAPHEARENAWNYLISGSIAVFAYHSAARWTANWSIAPEG